MKNPIPHNSIPKTAWLGLLTAAIIGGSATAVLVNLNGVNNQLSPQVSTPNAIDQANPSPPMVTAKDGELAVYWIESQKNKLVAVPIAIKAKSNNEAIAQTLESLVNQKPPESTLSSAIPANTKILSVTTKDQEIRINLSKEFTSGGGSASMQGRVIQVLYSVTSLEPNAKVYLSVEGQPLNYIGGEGLEIPQPMTRKDFSLEF
ncbi:MAG: GerMN domain-containing protein [Pseudanabaenaceae cyanobacterium bins.39]|nr:GerMN domain-containing protein [Pseudanabaenaceae cyanobacterium bins.39]